MQEIESLYQRLKQISQEIDSVYKDNSSEAIKGIVENSELLLKVKLANHVIGSLKVKGWFHPLSDAPEGVIEGAIYTFDIILDSHYAQTKGERTYNAGWKDALVFFQKKQHEREEKLRNEIENIKNMTVLEFANWLAD